MQPDRQFPPLDLSVRDERELVQILAQLALNEGVRLSLESCILPSLSVNEPFCIACVQCSKKHGKSLSTTTQIEKSRDSLDHRRH